MQEEIVSIIVVTCGVKNYLKSCLDSIRRQTYKNLEVIVIDNSLKQNFSRGIIRNYPEIRLYYEPNNLFYAEALNKGIRISKGDFVLCLNDDVILDEQFILQALQGFCLDTSVGMVSGKVLRSGGLVVDSAGLFLTLWRTAGERGYGYKDEGQFDKSRYVFGVNGAAAFYRRKMLESVKIGSDYFDSDFRMFYEDLDIAWRGNLFGWKAYYFPQAIAYHLRGGSARQEEGIGRPCARRYLNDNCHLDLIKNRYLSIIKNESIIGFLLHLPFILFYDFPVYFYLLFFKPRLLKKLFSKSGYVKPAIRKRKIIKGVRSLHLTKNL